MVFTKNLSFSTSYPKSEIHALSAFNPYNPVHGLSAKGAQHNADSVITSPARLKHVRSDGAGIDGNALDIDMYLANTIGDTALNTIDSRSEVVDSLETILQTGLTGQLALWTAFNGIAALDAESAVGVPIVYAAKIGDENMVRALVSCGANVNCSGADDFTALHWAIVANDVKMVALLCSLGANRYVCMSEAILKGNNEVINIMTSDHTPTSVGNSFSEAKVHADNPALVESPKNENLNLLMRRSSASTLDRTAKIIDRGRETQQGASALAKRYSMHEIKSPLLGDVSSLVRQRPVMDTQKRRIRAHSFHMESVQSPVNKGSSLFNQGSIPEEANTLSNQRLMPTNCDILNQFPNLHIEEKANQQDTSMQPRYQSMSPPGGEDLQQDAWDGVVDSAMKAYEKKNIATHLPGASVASNMNTAGKSGVQHHLIQRRRSASFHQTQMKNRNRRSMPAIDFSQSRGPYDSISTPNSPLLLERRQSSKTSKMTPQNLPKLSASGLHNVHTDFTQSIAHEGISSQYPQLTSAHLYESLQNDDMLLSSRASMQSITSTRDSLCGQLSASTLDSASQTPTLRSEASHSRNRLNAYDMELDGACDREKRMIIDSKREERVGVYNDNMNNSYNMGISGLMHLSGLSVPATLAQMPGQRSCCVCGTTETPQWRRDGNQPLCNACGLKQAHSKNRQAKNAKRREHYKLKKAEAQQRTNSES